MTSNEIRKSFFDFFEKKNHKIVPSAPMVVKDDPTLMFTNAGMNQFKDLFLGNAPIKYSRIADTQKCLRVSGKHNDLEEVGHDTYHHTMFEMLGNWSFGDYFKKEAIEWASEFLLDTMGLDKNRMYATVFEGDQKDGVPFDQEAYDLWKQILPESQILRGNKKDNFWEMGDSGPCGPCSELHYDLRDAEEIAKVAGADLVNKDNPLVIEIWNLVFMQFNRKADGTLEPLPANHVDTGMGFERLCMILQGKKSNYDTDIFQPLIQKIAELSSIPYGKDEQSDIAMRVIADHLRAISFSIADGQIPTNAKAGYVIRRILRRAVRYGYTYLNLRKPFICNVVPVLVEQLSEQFPELKAQAGFIHKIIEEEESSFLRTLSTGINMIEGFISKLKSQNKEELSGEDAFLLYDTYGFPIDLTELICKENDLHVNIAEFEAALQQQKERSRSAAVVETDDWVEVTACPEPTFIGYDSSIADVRVARYRKVTNKNKTQYHIVLTETPFYGNSGGQVGEIGRIYSQNETIRVVDTIKENGLTIHIANAIAEQMDHLFTAEVDMDARRASAANHTATHLLQKALKTVLGDHVEQKGSLVSPSILRFDFSHYQKMTNEEIDEVVRLVNREIRTNHLCDENRCSTLQEAKDAGAMMLFGEKYGEHVRTIGFGDSLELCGGIHTQRTGEIGGFSIISEGAIAAGIRRIEAITGELKTQYDIDNRNLLQEVQMIFNTKSIKDAVNKLMATNSDLSKEIEAMMKEKNEIIRNRITSAMVESNGVQWYVAQKPTPVQTIKDVAMMIYGQMPNAAFIAGTVFGDKPGIVVMFGKNCVAAGANAGAIVKEVSKIIGGGGGGQAHIASAGGKDCDKIGEAINRAKELAEIALK